MILRGPGRTIIVPVEKIVAIEIEPETEFHAIPEPGANAQRFTGARIGFHLLGSVEVGGFVRQERAVSITNMRTIPPETSTIELDKIYLYYKEVKL